jgi:hypothetical protein
VSQDDEGFFVADDLAGADVFEAEALAAGALVATDRDAVALAVGAAAARARCGTRVIPVASTAGPSDAGASRTGVSTTGATGAPGVDVGLAARLLVSPTAAGDSFTVSGVAGALAPTTPAATIRKTGASTSEASDRRRSVARPVHGLPGE